jgi:hypothetical protein
VGGQREREKERERERKREKEKESSVCAGGKRCRKTKARRPKLKVGMNCIERIFVQKGGCIERRSSTSSSKPRVGVCSAAQQCKNLPFAAGDSSAAGQAGVGLDS